VRREFPAKVKVVAFQRAAGCCEKCGSRLFPGNIQYDHRLPDALGGEPTLENCAVLCRSCHSSKSAREDVPRIRKADRQRRGYIGANKTKRPMPGTRASGIRKHMNGTVERW